MTQFEKVAQIALSGAEIARLNWKCPKCHQRAQVHEEPVWWNDEEFGTICVPCVVELQAVLAEVEPEYTVVG